MEGAADNLKSISAKINQGQGTVGALINDKSIYREASAGAAAFDDDMEALKHNFLLRGFFKKRGYEDSDRTEQICDRQIAGGAVLPRSSLSRRRKFSISRRLPS